MTGSEEDAQGSGGKADWGKEERQTNVVNVQTDYTGQEAEQPSAANDGNPQPDSSRLPHPRVPDGMDHSQAAVQAGQEVEQRLAKFQ